MNYYQDFLNNISNFKEKVTVLKGYSHRILRTFQDESIFDFAYIDGAHTSYELLTDAVNPDVPTPGWN